MSRFLLIRLAATLIVIATMGGGPTALAQARAASWNIQKSWLEQRQRL